MAGFFEVRVQGGGMNHRLFCVLERDAEDLGGSSIVCIDGLSKPPRSAATTPGTTGGSSGTAPSSRSGGPCSSSQRSREVSADLEVEQLRQEPPVWRVWGSASRPRRDGGWPPVSPLHVERARPS